jgi:hypothetical protein
MVTLTGHVGRFKGIVLPSIIIVPSSDKCRHLIYHKVDWVVQTLSEF